MSKAASTLGVSATVVSSWIAQLEDTLGVRLLKRTTRRIQITQEGQEYYLRCKQILADVAEAGDAVTVGRSLPRGLLRISAPVALGRRQIAPIVPAYNRRYPDVRIELVLSDRMIELEEEGFDLAFRSWSPSDSGLIARKLGSLRRIVCAAPSYLEHFGTPQTPDDLGNHHCLILSSGGRSDQIWQFERHGKLENIQVSGNMSSNSTEVIAEWTLAGLGLAMKSTWDVEDDIRCGRLITVLDDYMIQGHAFYVLYQERQYLPARIRTFIDFTAERLKLKDQHVDLPRNHL